MPEIKKRIVIASVLKPLNDTRMTEKIACSLADDPIHEVHVIGFPSAMPADARITFHTFPSFKRLSLARLFASMRILRTILRINPSIVIVTTHELLIVSIVAKMLLPIRLIYDVQENYYLNIRHTEAFPIFLRLPIAEYVRFKEWLASIFIDHYFIAETVYATQLKFLKGKFTILENKFKRIDLHHQSAVNNGLIFSGTLSRSTGVFRAIDLARKLHAADSSITLTIIGFAAIEQERKQLKTAVKDSPFIQLIGGHQLVSHEEIIKTILESGAGIIGYELNPATQGRIPTKLYEYLGCGLPVLFIDSEPEWLKISASTGVDFVSVNSREIEIYDLLTWVSRPKSRGTFPESLYWKSEAIKLQTAISAM